MAIPEKKMLAKKRNIFSKIYYQRNLKIILLGTSLGFFVFFFAALFSRLNIDVHHQGIMFSAAMRVLNGDALYIGNSFYYGPLVPILNATGMLIFGKHLVVLQLMAAACYGGIATLLWRIWARFLPEWLSAITVFFSFLLAPFLYWEFHPWSSVYSLLFLLLSLYLTFKWIETQRIFLLSFVGVFSALAFWSRQTVGLALGLIMLLVIFISAVYLHEEKSVKRKSLLFYLSAFISTLLLGGIILFANDSLRAWFDSCFSSRLDWAISISGEGSRYSQVFGAIILCLFDLFKTSIWLLLPVAMLLALAAIIIDVIRDKSQDKAKFAIFISYILVCIASWLQYYPVTDPRHHFWSALPLFAIPVIFLWQVYGRKLNPLNGMPLSSCSKLAESMVLGISGLVILCFSGTYYVEVKQRLLVGVQLDASLTLLPAWKRLSLYDTPFVNPPILQGMLGTKSQVDSLSRLHDEISTYIANHPSVNLKSNSGWDFLAPYYLVGVTKFKGEIIGSIEPPLLLNDSPLIPDGYKLLAHEITDPAFAYQATSPGHYFLFSPIASLTVTPAITNSAQFKY